MQLNLNIARWVRPFLTLLAIIISYIIIAWLSLQFAFTAASVTSIWPLAGIALAILVRRGLRFWPIILIGDFAVAIGLLNYPLVPALLVAVATTLEIALGATIIRRWSGSETRLETLKDVVVLILGAALACTTLGATLAVFSMYFGGVVPWEQFGQVWVIWWAGDILAKLVMTPVLLTWRAMLRWPQRWQLRVEYVGFYLLLMLVAFITFVTTPNYTYVLLLFTVYAAVRLGIYETALATFLIAVVALERTNNGFGPFVLATPPESVLYLQVFIGVLAVASLMLSTVNAQRVRNIRNLQLSAELGQTLSRSLDLTITGNRVTQHLTELLADWAILDVLEADCQVVRVAVASQRADLPEVVEGLKRYPARLNSPARGEIGKTLLDGMAQLRPKVSRENIVEVAHDAEHLRMIETMEVTSAMIVPLKVEERVIGVLALYRCNTDNPFTPDDLMLAELVASYGALALANAQAHQAQQTTLLRQEQTLALLDTLLMGIPIGFAWLDRNLICQRANQNLATLAQQPVEQLVGQSIATILPNFPTTLLPLLQQIVDQQQPIERYEYINANTTTSSVYLINAYPIMVRNNLLGIGVLLVDLTEFRALQQRLSTAERLESIGRLSGSVAHDFNGLLAVIQGAAELLKENLAQNTENREDAIAILEAAQRGQALCRQLLTFARQQPQTPQLVELSHLLRTTTNLLDRLLPRMIRLEVRGLDCDPQVRIDPSQFDQVVMNLGLNARDAMPNGGVLRFDLSCTTLEAHDVLDLPQLTPGAYVILRVSDTGTGMDVATQRRIFEPFFTTKANSGGFGVGLATVYGILRQNNGTIMVESALGQGTCFIVYLPLVAERYLEEAV